MFFFGFQKDTIFVILFTQPPLVLFSHLFDAYEHPSFPLACKLKILLVKWLYLQFNFAASVANGDQIEVWIQSKRGGNKWHFQDGSPMPVETDDVCPFKLSYSYHENSIRVNGSTNFQCWDKSEKVQYYLLCENYRQFVFNKDFTDLFNLLLLSYS